MSTIPPAGKNNLWFRATGADSAIVFVHGVLSDSRSCWLSEARRGTVYWPDLIATDRRFCNASIYLAGYYTAIDSEDFEIRDCANQIIAALRQPDIDGNESVLRKEKITFVCHSMGGVVVRYMLEANQRDFANKDIGLVLIASPSYGSPDADTLSWLVTWFRQEQGYQLQWASPALRELDARFRRMRDQAGIPKLCGIEFVENHYVVSSKWLRGTRRRRVVPADSASRYFSDARIVPDSNHFTICKPRSQEDPVHGFLLDFVSQHRLLPETGKELDGERRVEVAHTDPPQKAGHSVSTDQAAPPEPPSPTDARLLIESVSDRDPLVALPAAVELRERPTLVSEVVSCSSPTVVSDVAIRYVLSGYPGVSAAVLVGLLGSGEGRLQMAANAVRYFDPAHAPYCERKIAAYAMARGNVELRPLAIEALGYFGSTGWAFQVGEAFEESDRYEREKVGAAVLKTLGRLFVRSSESDIGATSDALIGAIGNVRAGEQHFLVGAGLNRILDGCGPRHADEMIRNWLSVDRPETVALGAETLGTYGIRRAVGPLIKTLEAHLDSRVSTACWTALGMIGGDEAVSYIFREGVVGGNVGTGFALSGIEDETLFLEACRSMIRSGTAFLGVRAAGRRNAVELVDEVRGASISPDPLTRGCGTLALARLRAIGRSQARLAWDQSAGAIERIFTALAMLVIDAELFPQIELSFRADVGRDSFLLWPALQADILEVLRGTGRSDARALADAWSPFYLHAR